MIAYVDASVILRIVLGEQGALAEWGRITRRLSSQLTRIECMRTVERARLRFDLPDARVADQRAAILAELDVVELIRLDDTVLARAAEPFPTILGSLDAVHLASAVLARVEILDLLLATHDRELAVAARAMGFRVLGAPRGA